MREDLGVPAGAELVPVAEELLPQRGVVVDLAVLDDMDGAVLVRDRLVAGLEVDDREPAGGEREASVADDAVRVRPAMGEDGAHPLGALRGRRPGERHHSGNPAHGALRYSAGPEVAARATASDGSRSPSGLATRLPAPCVR